jgi:hypothetical protein
LCCLPGISSEFQASQAASLRKKTEPSAKALWDGLIGDKMSFGKPDEFQSAHKTE